MVTHTQRTTTHWPKLLLFQRAGRASFRCDWRFTDNQSFISVVVKVFAVSFFLTEICAVIRHISEYFIVKHKKANNLNKMFVFYPTTMICHLILQFMSSKNKIEGDSHPIVNRYCYVSVADFLLLSCMSN